MSTAARISRRTVRRTIWLIVLLLLSVTVSASVPPNPASAASCSSPSFGQQSAFEVGQGPSSVEISDFNSDGEPDLATANFVSDNVSVLMGDGAGSFSAQSVFPAGNGPDDLAVGDFNHDANPDLAVANQISDDVSVLLGDGTGGLGPQTRYPSAGVPAGTQAEHQPVDVVAEDFDNDGNLDLAVAHIFNGVSLLWGQGSGSFGASVRVQNWLGEWKNPVSLAPGDFDGDGDLDLAIGGPEIGGAGDVGVSYNSGSRSFTVPSWHAQDVNTNVAARDMNRDGNLDLVASDNGFDRVGVLLGKGSSGSFRDLQFESPPTLHSVGGLPTSLVPADFTGDGRPDVAVSRRNQNDVSIFLGNGTSRLGSQTNFAAGDGPEGLAAGYFNDDGGPDLAVANSPSDKVSILLNTCPIGPVDLRPTAVEVTQSVQDLNNSAVLIEGKRTFARVHIGTNAEDHSRVTARLYGYDANGASLGSPLWPLNPGAVIDPTTSPDRGKINDSFLFELPPSWTKGAVTLKAEVNPNQTVSEGDYANNITSTSITFQPTRALKVRLVKYEYYETDGSFHAPTEADLNYVESRLRREFPISKLAISRGATFTDEERFSTTLALPADYQVMLARLKHWRQTYEPSNTGVVYLGITTRHTGGLAEDIPGWNAIAASSESATHEVGHLMGRRHVSCTTSTTDEEGPDLAYPYEGGKIGGPAGDTARFYGFDVGDASLPFPALTSVVPNSTGEEMSYCHPSWLSDYNYTAIRNHIQQNFSAVDPEGDFLSVYGTIDLGAQDASLTEVSRDPRVSEIPPLEPGPYSIRLFDDAGMLLADHPFTPARVHVEPTGEEAGMIAQVVNFAPGTRRVAVYSEQAGREIGSVSVSASAPSVSNVAAQLPPAGGSIELSWNSSDPDGDQLRSTILYSDDGGTEWQTIASGVKSTAYSVDPSELPGTGSVADGLFRVIVDDGVLTAQAKSEPLIVPGKPPEARISAPLTGATYLVGQSTNFEGVGEDLEDGTLEDAKLSWSSDLDGPLGTGRLHTQRLSKGTHRVTLTATDSDGQTGTATATVNVVAGYENPDPDDSTPPGVDCAAADGLWHATDVGISCNASDGGSGLANPEDSSFSLSTAVQAGTENPDTPTASRNVCDRAGNCAVAGPISGNKVDKQAPGIGISAPAEGASYILRQAVVANYTCADGGSGVTSCSGTVPDGSNFDTSSLGPKDFRVAATDAVGNQDSREVAYDVIYDFRGFFTPVDNTPRVNVVKAGLAVPVKFSLGGNQGLDIFVEGYPQSGKIPNDPNADLDNIEVTVSAGSSTLKYDDTTGQYTYVWKTLKDWAGTSRQLTLKLKDGTEHKALFKFTK